MEIRSSVLAAVETLSSAYPMKLSETLVNAYAVALDGISDHDIGQGLKRALTEHTGAFITPAQFRRHCLGTDPVVNKAKAHAAWVDVLHGIRSIGRNRPICWADPKIPQAIRKLGGWVHLCSLSEKEMDFKFNDFAVAYASMPDDCAPEDRITRGAEPFDQRRMGYVGEVKEPVKLAVEQRSEMIAH